MRKQFPKPPTSNLIRRTARMLRLFSLLSVFSTLFITGCLSGFEAVTGLMGPDASLAEDLKQQGSIRQARAQSTEGDSKPAKKEPASTRPPLPAGPGDFAGPPTGTLAPPQPGKVYRINVGAWVNGRPLFVEEIFFQAVSPQMMAELNKYPPAEQAQKKKELLAKLRDNVIDQELMYQDAIYKLEKGNPKTLDKIKGLAREEYRKQLARVRESLKNSKQSDDTQMREFMKLLQRKTEREFIATEYMKSVIYPKIVHMIGPREIRAYYDKNRNEFQKPEHLQWQDVFIAVGKDHPTITDARRFAEKLVADFQNDDDFKALMSHDDGDSKDRNGEGIGHRRGDIRPMEVEEHLYKLRDGQFGPVVELSTGVHIIRLVKHDLGGPLPFNEAVQNKIRNELRGKVAEREYKHLVRELRNRAVILIEEEP